MCVYRKSTYMPHIATDLPTLHQKVQRRHPFLGADACLPREVVQVRDQSLHHVRQASVAALRVDADGIRRDIVDCQV